MSYSDSVAVSGTLEYTYPTPYKMAGSTIHTIQAVGSGLDIGIKVGTSIVYYLAYSLLDGEVINLRVNNLSGLEFTGTCTVYISGR
jgi:hypothetical protein